MAGKTEGSDVPWWTSCRLALALIGFLGFVNLYNLRVNMSVAIVCMVNQTALKMQRLEQNGDVMSLNQSDNGMTYSMTSNVSASESPIRSCKAERVGNATTNIQDGDFEWPKEIQGLILASFFWGYAVTQVPGGWLATRFGGKRVFGWSMFITAIATLLCPIAAKFHYILLLVFRFIAGLGEGVVWPAMHSMWANWAPPLERSKLIGFTYAGAQVGNVIVLPIAALLCEYGFDGGWPSIFYVLGGVGIIWFVAWMLLVSDRPGEHPRISDAEREYIQKSLAGHMKLTRNTQVEKTPWLEFLKSKPVWGIIITHTCTNWGTYTFLTNIPTYMREMLKFDMKSNGLLSAIPYIATWSMVNVAGFGADILRTKGLMNTTQVRKLFNSLGTFVPATMCIIISFMDCTQPYAAVACLTIGVGFIGCVYGSGFVVNHVDIAPKYAAILFGISNTAATIPGFLAPHAIGLITKDQTQAQWQTVFYITAVIFTVGAVAYLILGSGELQDWAREAPEETDASLKIPINQSGAEEIKKEDDTHV